MKVLLMLTMTTTLVSLLVLVSLWLPQATPDQEKLSPYECGFDPLGSARLPFSMRFFLVAILFLLFDLEITLLLPIPWAMSSMNPMNTMLYISLVLMLLTLGLVYEWNQGGLDWAE
uniref:NADH-ubiquinone oxidoreductase chain 3 n=1 Tax=Tenuidactylus dadunensis TaxID=3079921 RepID=A0AA96UYD0_9SAUR|nr:NADH dehydrogenase subunit 3 [Tenuidactylus dadunensis]WNX96100.1 NADH dehydrogenase subunit 3 [Tenuidactylus dadunensis]